MKPLGLLWWTVEVVYFSDPKEIKKVFKRKDGNSVIGRVYADWEYMQATIHINVPVLDRLSKYEIERAVVHELVHILVNEMREPGILHEERVVTQLQKAFMWVENDQFG